MKPFTVQSASKHAAQELPELHREVGRLLGLRLRIPEQRLWLNCVGPLAFDGPKESLHLELCRFKLARYPLADSIRSATPCPIRYMT